MAAAFLSKRQLHIYQTTRRQSLKTQNILKRPFCKDVNFRKHKEAQLLQKCC